MSNIQKLLNNLEYYIHKHADLLSEYEGANTPSHSLIVRLQETSNKIITLKQEISNYDKKI